jgi:uncharacterized ferritin-like protein (DUF455 family)
LHYIVGDTIDGIRTKMAAEPRCEVAAAGAACAGAADARPGSVHEYGILVLNTHDKRAKAELTLEAVARYARGELSLLPSPPARLARPPAFPARPLDLEVVEPTKAPKRGGGGSVATRIALIHAQAHIESFAIDLSWDVLTRFAEEGSRGVRLPREFFEDWLRVAGEEARHYSMWATRLEELGSRYGAVPVHNALWGSAAETAHDLCARLAIVHMVHEARGLDVAPATIDKLRAAGDARGAELLSAIVGDEVTHVGSGMRWFRFVCAQHDPPLDALSEFHALVRKHFRGVLKPPFNERLRAAAGFTEEWYLPLTHKGPAPAPAPAPAPVEAPEDEGH